MRIATMAAVLAGLLTLTGCASLPPACVAPAEWMASAELLFGRNVGGRLAVSDAAFAGFLASEITPRFPDGLTVLDAKGQWHDGDTNRLIHEPSKLVLIIFRDDPARRLAIAAIADAYKRRFIQHSVLTSIRTACVSF
jgi:hypothetical protein